MSTPTRPAWSLTCVGVSLVALVWAGWVLSAIASDDRAAGGRLAACASGAPWPRLALDRDAHARRYAARLGLGDGLGGVFIELLDREAWTAIDAEVTQAQVADRLRGRLRWQAPGALVALALTVLLAGALAWRARRTPAWLAGAGLMAFAALALAGWAITLEIGAGITAVWR